ncbi:MAG TPA: D-2-hydroxyacid dehydrogenase [Steroidobacteraceae bacterium]|nr:D-2-hydroxyacid dehydrogenase [Steroidobacteraceae bacterium]
MSLASRIGPSRSALVALVVAVAGLPVVTVADAPAAAPGTEAQALIEKLGLEESAAPVRERKDWARPKAVLVLNAAPELLSSLQAVAPGIKLLTADDADEAARLAGQADAVLGFCTPEVLEAGRRIRWVQVLSAGVERCVAVPAIRNRGILLTNMQRVAGPVMAEHVLAMMFAFARGLDFYIPERLERRWTNELPDTSRMVTLEGKTVLVVGLGGIGSEVARRADALGLQVDAVRASGRTGPEYVREVGLAADLLRLAGRADYVVNTTPLTPETKGLFDRRFFASMKRGAYFFNVGRGQSVDQDALIEALKNGQLGGAGLDVTEPEPLPPGSPLWTLPNVILTPHVSTRSDLGDAVRFAVLRENLRRYVAGEKMLSVVDVGKGY